MVNRALRSGLNSILIDVSRDEGNCQETGMAWQNQKCFYLVNFRTDGGEISTEYNGPKKSEDARFSLMTGKYGFDLGEFYLNACHCRRHVDVNDEPPILKSDAIPIDGSLPTCFFNVLCRAGTIKIEHPFAGPINAGPAFARIEEVPVTDDMVGAVVSPGEIPDIIIPS